MPRLLAAAISWLRQHTSTLTREQLYGIAALLIGGSGVVNGVDGRIEPALVSVVTSTLVLLLAAINSRPLVALVYVFLGAVAGLGQIVAVVYDGVTWVSWIGYGAGLLGTVLAFFRVNTRPDSVLPAMVHIDPSSYTALAGSQLSVPWLNTAVQTGVAAITDVVDDLSYSDPLRHARHSVDSTEG